SAHCGSTRPLRRAGALAEYNEQQKNDEWRENERQDEHDPWPRARISTEKSDKQRQKNIKRDEDQRHVLLSREVIMLKDHHVSLNRADQSRAKQHIMYSIYPID